MLTIDHILTPMHAGRVLDVATGRGSFVQVLLDNLASCTEITAIDSLGRALQAARAAFDGQPGVRFGQMDAASLGFPSASFDTVCIANSLHHMDRLPAVLREMARVLRPGGRLLVCEMYRDGQTAAQQTHVDLHHWWAQIDSALGVTHNQTFTRQEIIDLLAPLGLRELALYDTGDLSGDPFRADHMEELNRAIDTYCQRAAFEGAEANIMWADLQAQGAALRQRLQQVGFHSATQLVAVGVRP